MKHKSPALIGQVKVEVRDDTIVRLGGNGDDFCFTWAADDRQLIAVQDGAGWDDPPREYYNSRLWAVVGNPNGAKFEAVPGYPDKLIGPGAFDGTEQRYYGFGTLAIEESLYQYLSVFGPMHDRPRWIGSKLIYSPDNGQTWCNQDGSTPVRWEEGIDRDKLVFFGEPQEAFSLLMILQMGQAYRANTDGYIYVYSTNGNTDGSMNELVMFRAPKDQILFRRSYEFFAGFNNADTPTWSSDIDARAAVHTFPHGWVNDAPPEGQSVVESWLPSVAYNIPLRLYMMVNSGIGVGEGGHWFGKPSYLGIYLSETPWGPWVQVHEDTSWTPDGDTGARCYAPQIAPRWISDDGTSFWLVWTDFQDNASAGGLDKLLEVLKSGPIATSGLSLEALRSFKPYYSFNTQRVDLILPE
jgi:hypothetical protein